MAIDDVEEAKGEEGEQSATPPQPVAGAPPAEEEDRGARVDAAKAFFRAMYAGEEPPASFGQPQEQGKGGADSATQTACRNCEAMEFSLRDAEAKMNEAETLYKRMAADFENYRRRMERQGEESVALGVKKAAEAMVPALDDLDRAMMYLNPDLPAEKLIESFNLVAKRILQCMEGLGVKPIQAIGEPFDPKFHEPVQQIETTEYADGIVMGELRRGYMLLDKVVRPSLVNVASNSTGVVTGPAQAATPATAAEEAPAATAVPSDAGPSAEAIEQAQPASEELPTPPAPPPAAGFDGATTIYDLGDVEDS